MKRDSARADLQHMVVGTQFRQRDDFAHDVGINQEVLAEPFVRWREIRDRHRSIPAGPAGRTRSGLGRLFHQIGQRGSEIVDEIGKLFYQIVGK